MYIYEWSTRTNNLFLLFIQMGKRKGYKAVYGGNTDQSTKKCKYSANSIDANENTKGTNPEYIYILSGHYFGHN